MSGNGSLPPGWASARIDSIARTQTGGTPRRGHPDYFGGSIPWVKSGELGDSVVQGTEETITDLGLRESNAKLFPKGTLCIALYGATVGKLGILGIDAATNQAVCGIFLPDSIDIRYAYHYLLSIRTDLINLGKGGAQSNISNAIVKNTSIPIAPTNEQRRIVAKIEELFSDLDAGVAALARVRANLKRYRASVLKAAVEGRLTEAWRREHPDTEPAPRLLERILAERRRKWEAQQLAQYKAKGKKPPPNWRDKYKEPAAPDTTHLPDLPKGWCWATWDQVSPRVTVGHVGRMKDRYVTSGIPFLRSQNVRELRFDPEGLLHIPQDFHDELSKSRLQGGDLAVVRSGSVGITCVIPEELGEANCADLVIIKRPDSVLPQFGAYYMNSIARGHIEKGKVGVALTHFNTNSVATMPIILAPPEEQQEIVQRVEYLLSLETSADKVLCHSMLRAKRLRQSILKRAFEGKLVPQDPKDVPAEALLESVHTDRDAKEASPVRKTQPHRRERKGA